MTQNQTPCPRCHRATPDGLLCTPCTSLFERACADLGALLPELDTVIERQDHAARAINHRARGDVVQVQADDEYNAIPPQLRSRDPRTALIATPLPVNLDAADVKAAVLMKLLEHAVRFTGDDPATEPALHGPACPTLGCGHDTCRRARPRCGCGRLGCSDGRPACPGLECGHRHCQQVRAHTVPAAGRLLTATRLLRRHLLAAEIVDDILDCARRVTAAVDLRDPDMYMGPCEATSVGYKLSDAGDELITVETTCGVHMYGQLGDPVVQCPACGTRYRVATRKRWLLGEAREVWARPADIARALAALDLDLTQARLNDWITRDRQRHARRCWPGQECGHILQRGLDSDAVDEDGRPLGRPVYRVGDVIDRVERLRAEREARDGAAGQVAAS